MKWRKVKKQFKKTKHRYLGVLMCATDQTGNTVYCIVNDVLIAPDGCGKVNYQFCLEPIQEKVFIPKFEEEPKSDGFSFSMDFELKTPTKELRKLLEL